MASEFEHTSSSRSPLHRLRKSIAVRCLAGQLCRPERAQLLELPPQISGPRQHARTEGGKKGPAAAQPPELCPATAAGGGKGREGWWLCLLEGARVCPRFGMWGL